MGDINLDDYVDVAERLRTLREKYPDAVLRPFDPANPYKIEVIGDQTFVVYTAVCLRTPEELYPAVAVAWEPFPGKTPYTRGSELMNAETSAWGRAIVAALVAESNKIASKQEVRNRREESGGARQEAPRSSSRSDAPKPPTDAQRNFISRLQKELDVDDQAVSDLAGEPKAEMTIGGAKRVLDILLAVKKGEVTLGFDSESGKVFAQ